MEALLAIIGGDEKSVQRHFRLEIQLFGENSKN
jgi:hypothetical protein